MMQINLIDFCVIICKETTKGLNILELEKFCSNVLKVIIYFKTKNYLKKIDHNLITYILKITILFASKNKSSINQQLFKAVAQLVRARDS